MSNSITRTRHQALADIAAMRDSLHTDQPYVSPMRFDELRAEWRALAEADDAAAWRRYEDNVIDWDAWCAHTESIAEEGETINGIAQWMCAVAADMEAGLM